MTPEKTASVLTDQQIVERLAVEVMGWKIVRDYHQRLLDGKGHELADDEKLPASLGKGGWNPLTDWNHWRQVEEKVMEDGKLHCKFIESVVDVYSGRGPRGMIEGYMKADLRTRCLALISVLDSSHA